MTAVQSALIAWIGIVTFNWPAQAKFCFKRCCIRLIKTDDTNSSNLNFARIYRDGLNLNRTRTNNIPILCTQFNVVTLIKETVHEIKRLSGKLQSFLFHIHSNPKTMGSWKLANKRVVAVILYDSFQFIVPEKNNELAVEITLIWWDNITPFHILELEDKQSTSYSAH